MNVLWNTVNLGVAILGFTHAQNSKKRHPGAQESLKVQQKIEKVFLINGGLDFAYIGTGIYLHHRGSMKNSVRQRGYGSSIILQGTFLLLFDFIMHDAERHNGNKLRRFLEKNHITFNGRKAGIVFKM